LANNHIKGEGGKWEPFNSNLNHLSCIRRRQWKQ